MPASLPYVRQRYLLTQAEREFFTVLQRAAPSGWYVFPQVRLANLLQLRKGTRNWKPHFSRIAQKCVDFVLCDAPYFSPQLVIELDDSSHNRPDRQARDNFVDEALRSAGLPILHVRWQRSYDDQELATQIRQAAGLSIDRPMPVVSPLPVVNTAASRLAGAPAAAAPTATTTATATRWACRHCKAEVTGTAKFCPICGNSLEQA